jgi:hypothetical protein
MDCRVASLLAMTKPSSRFPYSPDRNFLGHFVDGMFTTFIKCPFTNAFNAIRRRQVIPCVSHAGHAD